MNWMLLLTLLNLVMTGLYFYKSVVLLELTQELNTFDKLHTEFGRQEIEAAWETIEDFHENHEHPACALQEYAVGNMAHVKAVDGARARLVHWYQKVTYFHRHGLLEDRLFAEFPGAFRTQQFIERVEPLSLLVCAQRGVPDCHLLFDTLRSMYGLPARSGKMQCVPDVTVATAAAQEKEEL
ncbi:hypothetical protein SDRG_09028 [Saprolegnia diclina VS20]|uniref:Uncharacterized protein n=1 Tax=Saprolegnia diclina (strain VS20) TaxID=1156394 RepID=T0QFP0_SAPDV|nr:hypothetical protein SDRG_09028 [Saprolegnia diclina VS20]EQC33521.1 hypothetical protein SDRG_09028 [Saprolegnia diclina VS20]|eukprot:XP_008613161.1 hypothetical protein SDRG_09028 [Saprolegnia diclina VS20]